MEKLRKNTIDNVIIENYRMCGNTTRQVDSVIQSLFKGYIVEVKDHYTGRDSSKSLFKAILRRLSFEHKLEYLIEKELIRIDRNKLEIELL